MKRLLLPLLAALILGSCVSAPDRFLVERLDDEAKARALTDAGIEQYTIHLVQGSDYETIGEIRGYFVNALALAPADARAQHYLALVDAYRKARLAANLKSADELLAKKNRTADDDLRLVLTVDAAVRLDPGDPDARRLLNATADIRASTIRGLVESEQAALAKITPDMAEDSRDRLLVDGWRSIDRAFAIDPDARGVSDERPRMKAQVAAIGSRRLQAARQLIAAGKFSAARTAVGAMDDLNRRSGGLLDAAVRSATYELDYQWAKWLYEQKDYPTAAVRVDAALAARRGAEAVALKARIAEARARTEAGESFDAGLAQADKLIASGELVAACRRLDALADCAKDKGQLAQLDPRRQRIRAALGGLYEQGVACYRDERFKEAVEALETVVSIDVAYEQASDYLMKARAKLRLIEQF